MSQRLQGRRCYQGGDGLVIELWNFVLFRLLFLRLLPTSAVASAAVHAASNRRLQRKHARLRKRSEKRSARRWPACRLRR
jgi:hypothetical protein